MSEQHSSLRNPGVWGLYSVAVLCVCLGMAFSGTFPSGSQLILISILAACSIIQVIGAVVMFKRGEVLLGCTIGLFGTVVALGAAFTIAIMVFGASRPGDYSSEVMGVFWISTCIIMAMFAIGFKQTSWFLFIAVAIAALAFLLRGIFELTSGPAFLSLTSGYLLIAFGILSIYSGTELLIYERTRKTILPIGKSISATMKA